MYLTQEALITDSRHKKNVKKSKPSRHLRQEGCLLLLLHLCRLRVGCDVVVEYHQQEEGNSEHIGKDCKLDVADHFQGFLRSSEKLNC